MPLFYFFSHDIKHAHTIVSRVHECPSGFSLFILLFAIMKNMPDSTLKAPATKDV